MFPLVSPTVSFILPQRGGRGLTGSLEVVAPSSFCTILTTTTFSSSLGKKMIDIPSGWTPGPFRENGFT